ncbi:MAG: polysaccharide deacetylase family protein [Acidobacteriota bacterium]
MRHPLSVFTSTNLVVPFHEVPSATWLERVLGTLSRRYRFVSLSDLDAYVGGERRFNNRCHVTFDDGHVTFYEDAAPLLKRMGIPATLFVSPKIIADGTAYWFQELTAHRQALGDQRILEVAAEVLGCRLSELALFSVNSVMLCLPVDDISRVLEAIRARYGVESPRSVNITLAQLSELADSGDVTIGAHTLDHPVLSNETDDRARREIQGSVADLARMLGRPVTAFAYPNGTEGFDFGAREQALLRDAGVRLAFSTDPGFLGPRTPPLAIPRGGCPSLAGEPQARTAARLLLLPVWRALSRVASRGRRSEAQERESIRQVLSARARKA